MINIHIHGGLDVEKIDASIKALSGKLTLLEGVVMADFAKINQALDTLQETIDSTQESIAALLTLIQSNPSPEELVEIERRLQVLQDDLAGTSFETEGNEEEPVEPPQEDGV